MSDRAAAKTRAKPGAEAAKHLLSLVAQIKEEKFGKEHVARCREKFADLSDDEFVTIMRKAFELGADPLNGELYFRIQDGAKGRRISVMTSIAAMRAFAERQGDYAGDRLPVVMVRDPDYRPGPGEEVSYLQFDRHAECERTNPLGIVSCTVAVYRFLHGEWRRQSATVTWTDYVPLTGGSVSAGPWRDIPVVMIQKVAEVAALRKAYPALGAVYVEEEMVKFVQQGREVGPRAPAPVVQRAVEHAVPVAADVAVSSGRVAPLAPGREQGEPVRSVCLDITVDFGDGEGPVGVPEDEFGMRVRTFLQDKLDTKNYQAVIDWFANNVRARTDYYNYNREDMLQIKRFLEIAQRDLPKQQAREARAAKRGTAAPRATARPKVEPARPQAVH